MTNKEIGEYCKACELRHERAIFRIIVSHNDEPYTDVLAQVDNYAWADDPIIQPDEILRDGEKVCIDIGCIVLASSKTYRHNKYFIHSSHNWESYGGQRQIKETIEIAKEKDLLCYIGDAYSIREAGEWLVKHKKGC